MLLRELWLDPHHILVTEKIQEDNIKEEFFTESLSSTLIGKTSGSVYQFVFPFFSFVDIVSRDLRWD